MWLLIGGCGFIGTNFARFLLENDYNFKIYDIHKPKYLPKNVKTIIGDIRDKTKLSKAMKDCDIVFHLATVPPSVRLSKREIYDIDVNGMQNVLMTAEKHNIKRVIFTSSASHVYGLVDKDLYPIKEDCPLHPINEYGKNKVLAEELCKKAAETTNVQTIILRLSMVMGPYNFDPVLTENARSLLNNKRVAIAGDGNSKNQSIHVNDVTAALVASTEISDSLLPNHDVFNISGNEVLTINEWMELARRASNSTSKITHLPLFLAKSIVRIAWWMNRTKIHPSYLDLMEQDQYFDISKAKHVLGWEPKYAVEDALRDTIEFLRGNIVLSDSKDCCG
jgi:nucleoside-diphosphate-sugar epimerase